MRRSSNCPACKLSTKPKAAIKQTTSLLTRGLYRNNLRYRSSQSSPRGIHLRTFDVLRLLAAILAQVETRPKAYEIKPTERVMKPSPSLEISVCEFFFEAARINQNAASANSSLA